MCSHGLEPTAMHTLAVGGVAGSTAALFTTPFDTIKTRLQTQGINPTTGAVVGTTVGKRHD